MSTNRKKKILAKVLCMLIFLVFLLSISNEGLAAKSVGDKIKSNLKGEQTDEGKDFVTKILDPVLSAVRIVAAGMALIMTTYLGIQYMQAAPSEKAEIKNKLIALVLGMVVAFGAIQILSMIKQSAQESFK